MDSQLSPPPHEISRATELESLRKAGIALSADFIISSSSVREGMFRTTSIDSDDAPNASGQVIASRDRISPDSLIDEAVEELHALLSTGRKVISGDAADEILSLWVAVEPTLGESEARELRSTVIGRITTGQSLQAATVRRSATSRWGGE